MTTENISNTLDDNYLTFSTGDKAYKINQKRFKETDCFLNTILLEHQIECGKKGLEDDKTIKLSKADAETMKSILTFIENGKLRSLVTKNNFIDVFLKFILFFEDFGMKAQLEKKLQDMLTYMSNEDLNRLIDQLSGLKDETVIKELNRFILINRQLPVQLYAIWKVLDKDSSSMNSLKPKVVSNRKEAENNLQFVDTKDFGKTSNICLAER